MRDINMGATIARQRRAAGLKQEDVAAHLGVTKAAVSKWELGQSFPDVALLPRLAAFFNLTLDELFDYRPQMGEDEVRHVYLELFDLFEQDPQAAYARMDALVAGHYSCWQLLQQMGVLYAQRAACEPERSVELVGKAKTLFERVEAHTDDVGLARSARMMRATILHMEGDVDGAIALLESLQPENLSGIEGLLASLYQQKGDTDRCLKLHQTSMGWGVMNVMNAVSAQVLLYACDPDHLRALLRAGEGVMQGFALEEENPVMALTFFANASAACVLAGDDDVAEGYLRRFVCMLRAVDADNLFTLDQSVLYDRVPELAGGVASGTPEESAQMRALDLPRQLKLAVLGQETWSERRDDARFKSLLDQLEAL